MFCVDFFLAIDDYGEEDEFDEWDEPSPRGGGYNQSNFSDDALSTTSSDVNRIGMSALVIYSFEVRSLFFTCSSNGRSYTVVRDQCPI